MNPEKIALRKSIIKLHKKGKSQTDISFLLEVPQTTVSFWIRRFKKTNSLLDKPHPGSPSKLDKKKSCSCQRASFRLCT